MVEQFELLGRRGADEEEDLCEAQVSQEEDQEELRHLKSHFSYHLGQMVSLVDQPQIVAEVQVKAEGARGLDYSSCHVLVLQAHVFVAG